MRFQRIACVYPGFESGSGGIRPITKVNWFLYGGHCGSVLIRLDSIFVFSFSKGGGLVAFVVV